MEKEHMVRTNIATPIAKKLEKHAAKKGLTLNEYIRVILGEKANEIQE